MSEEIKDKKGKVIAKVAVNKEEAFWERTKTAINQEIESLENALKFNYAIRNMIGIKLSKQPRENKLVG